ncbi:8937_t:CDS:2 [Diversispora eburnea]|uniref:8937_t:CDS:1 n=1 Tax=Diversispora eburnea TaxID=1213867 RepID=A0A9N9AVJ2_9GLOM|nr:8937_t:CDS:2 [Diversispora eburnea]
MKASPTGTENCIILDSRRKCIQKTLHDFLGTIKYQAPSGNDLANIYDIKDKNDNSKFWYAIDCRKLEFLVT